MSSTVNAACIIARVNRRLARQGERLCQCRVDSRDYPRVGRFYVLDLATRFVVRSDVDLIDLATDVGALRSGEQVPQA